MNKIVLSVAFAVGMAMLSFSATVSDVVARQRWPWNGMVDIDYTITGEDTENTAIAVKVTDQDTGRIYTPTNFLEVPPTCAGRHRITWSTEADKLDLIASNVTVSVSLLKYDAVAVTNDLYYVIDLSGGPDAESWPVTCLSSVPKDGWTDEYKTKKLVLRRIEPGTITGIEDKSSEEEDGITIDSPYYIGVFEVTVAQWERMTGVGKASLYNSADLLPRINVTYAELRGGTLGVLYPDSTAVDPTNVVGVLRKKTGLVTLDLPTCSQWEYACRAGTTSYYNNGGSTEADLKVVGRYSGNCDDGRGGYDDTTVVGSYAPNAFGLYDMHGNAKETCLFCERKTWTHVHGGGFTSSFGLCKSNTRIGASVKNETFAGFRLCCSSEL